MTVVEGDRVPPVIDVHAHLVPMGLVERMLEDPIAGVSLRRHGEGEYSFAIEGAEPTRVLPARLVDLELREAWMDEQGIDIQVVSTWADLFGYTLEPGQGAEWARILNETAIEAVSGSSRYGAFASLPMQDAQTASEMIPEVLEQGFVGVTVAARIGETELDAPELEVFWESLDDNETNIFIHPGYASDDPRTSLYGMVNAVGRPVDTTIAAARILGAGIPERYPGAKILLAHGGGAISFILGRLRRNYELDSSVGDPGAGLSRLYFDSVVFDPDALCHVVANVGPDHVFLGSDYPFPIGDPSPTRVVDSAVCLSGEDRTAVLGGNAVSLLGITTSVRAGPGCRT